MKQEVRALLKTVNYWDFPEKPKEFLEFFSELFNEVPEECRDSTFLEYDLDSGYEGGSFCVDVYYTRLETDEEEAVRNSRSEDMMAAKKRRELKLLKELQEKYKGEKI